MLWAFHWLDFSNSVSFVGILIFYKTMKNYLPLNGYGRLLVFSFYILHFTFYTPSALAQHGIIPTPVSFEIKAGAFVIDSKTVVNYNHKDCKKSAELLANLLKVNGKSLLVSSMVYVMAKQTQHHILLNINSTPNLTLQNEGYELEVTPNIIKISANQPVGLFYGVQSLVQLLPVPISTTSTITVPACKITDFPRFGWRGLMLDVSRHFFTKEEVKNYIDLMVQYKLNTLHWHLTDDNGWRVEIKSLPKLTEVGAWRVQRFGRYGNRENPKEGEQATYGGFYTQNDIREVVKYAAERYVTIVPEIDVPGHSMAALAAYPELSTRKEPKKVNPGTAFSEWYANGTFKMLIENTLNPSDEKVYDFLDKVLTEVAELFPNKYIHIGGDEAYHGFWEADSNCKAFMKQNSLKSTHELQSYFVKRLEKIVNAKGKTLLGWDEILEGGLAPNAAVMNWQGIASGIEAAKQKHEVVMSPKEFAYLDYTQGDPSIETPIYASLSLKKTYQFEPIPDGVNPIYILGGQGNLWSEQIQNARHLQYMTYPRAFAIAETVWSPKENKNWDNFVKRVENHFARFDAAQLQICKAIYEPIITTRKEGDKLLCEMKHDMAGTEIYYSIDDSFPDKFSPKYSASFEIPKGNIRFRAIAYRNGQPIGRMLQIQREELEKRARNR